MEWLNEYHLGGIAIGICTFLIIGLFHPIVVKAEYYWGTRCWWIFLVLGIAGIIGTVLISDILIICYDKCNVSVHCYWVSSPSLLSGLSRRYSSNANAC